MIQSVERAIDLLHVVSKFPDGAGLSEIANKAGLKVQTANTLLKTLSSRNLLYFDKGRKRYFLGLDLLNLSTHIESRRVIDQVCNSVMIEIEKLFNELGENTIAAVHYQGQFFIVGKRLEGIEQGFSDWQITTQPHKLATGTVLISKLGEDFIKDYLKEHPDAKALKKESATAKKQGILIRSTKSLQAIALPIKTSKFPVTCAIGCSYSSLKKSKRINNLILKKLAAAAKRLEGEL